MNYLDWLNVALVCLGAMVIVCWIGHIIEVRELKKVGQ